MNVIKAKVAEVNENLKIKKSSNRKAKKRGGGIN
jgi:ABC-type sugar transport system ATPase subunit